MAGKKTIKCDTCGIEFTKYESKISTHNFCCRDCYLKYHSKDVPTCTCKICGKIFKGDKYNANKYCSRACYNEDHGIKNKIRKCPCCGENFEAKQSEDKYCSQECFLKILHEKIKGENHPNWKGGLSLLNDRHDSHEYKEWRQQVYIRDNYECQICGSKKKINAHHILSWKHYPEKRYDINNGMTLCGECHTKLHQEYGYDTAEPVLPR